MHRPWADDFRQFFADMGPRPEGYRLKRTDQNGHFEPNNVAWVPNSYVPAVSTSNAGPPSKTEALVGQTFNALTVVGLVRYQRRSGKGVYKAQVRCVCGETFDIFSTALGKTVSCGCLTSYDSRTGKCNYNFKGFREIRAGYWAGVKSHASDRRLTFAITPEYAWVLFEKQSGRCALSGVPLQFGVRQKATAAKAQTASLDRIDSALGYVEGNVQWVHKEINLMKMDFSVQDFQRWCALVTANCSLVGQ